jgi:hypothetical protein
MAEQARRRPTAKTEASAERTETEASPRSERISAIWRASSWWLGSKSRSNHWSSHSTSPSNSSRCCSLYNRPCDWRPTSRTCTCSPSSMRTWHPSRKPGSRCCSRPICKPHSKRRTSRRPPCRPRSKRRSSCRSNRPGTWSSCRWICSPRSRCCTLNRCNRSCTRHRTFRCPSNTTPDSTICHSSPSSRGYMLYSFWRLPSRKTPDSRPCRCSSLTCRNNIWTIWRAPGSTRCGLAPKRSWSRAPSPGRRPLPMIDLGSFLVPPNVPKRSEHGARP